MNKKRMEKAIEQARFVRGKETRATFILGFYLASDYRVKVKEEILGYIFQKVQLKRIPKELREALRNHILAHNLTVEDLTNPTHRLGRITK